MVQSLRIAFENIHSERRFDRVQAHHGCRQNRADRDEKVDEILNIIGSSTFWNKVGLISFVLRSLTLRLAESRRMAWGFSRLRCIWTFWAFLRHTKEEKGTTDDSFQGLLEDLIVRWKMRMNLYFDIGPLLLALVMDPRCKRKPLPKAVTPPKLLECLSIFEKAKCADIMQCDESQHPLIPR